MMLGYPARVFQRGSKWLLLFKKYMFPMKGRLSDPNCALNIGLDMCSVGLHQHGILSRYE